MLVAFVGLQSMPAAALPPSSQPLGQVSSAAVGQQTPGTMVIDYPGGFSASLPSRFRRADVGIVIRYVGAAKWKCLTRSEANALRRQGVDIAVVYETKANWMLGGRAAGVSAAKKARAAVRACGGPRQPFVYFACDVGTHRYATVNACLRGAASVLGANHVGIYGSYSVCANALKSGYASKAWQTEAWSGGKWLPQAVLYQKAKRFNGNLRVGYDSNLLRADDIGQWGYSGLDGSTWTAASAPAAGTLNSVAFIDASTGWAVGESGTVIRTTDGGSTWAAAATPATATLTAVAFTDANTGWAVGEHGTVIRTTDGGSTWASAATPATATLTSVAFTDALVGWAVGENGTVIRTTDGGSTWTAASTPATATLTSVAFTDSKTGWAVGDAGTVVRTTNGGSTWTAASTPATATLTSVAFTDSKTGWAVGEAGTVVRTTNGGSTWTTESAPTTATLTSVAFTDSSTGWAVGEAGTVIHTSDGGSTWTASATPATTTLRSVAFTDANTGWAVGEAGTVIRARKNGVNVFGSVRGVVTDAISGAPVSGASVQIGARPAVPTATDGTFVVARVVPGTYAVTLSSPRYITCAAKPIAVTAGTMASVKLRPTPRTVTALTKPLVLPGIPVHGEVVTFTATLSPAAATSSTISMIYLSHYEQKMVTKKVKGKWKKVRVSYWHQQPQSRLVAAAPGLLYTQTTLPPGKWRVYVRCLGSGSYLPCASATTGFSVQ